MATRERENAPSMSTNVPARDVVGLGKLCRETIDERCNVDGEDKSREVIIRPADGSNIEAVETEGGAREILIELTYSTQEACAGIVADGSYFMCPGPSKRASSWFPCVERGDALTLFEFSVSAPRRLQVIASAHWDRLAKCDPEEADEDGFRLRHYFSGLYPSFPHEMRMFIGKFQSCSSPVKGVTLFAPVGDQYSERLEVAGVGVGKAITAFEEYLGHPYPVSCLNMVFLPDEYVTSRDEQGCCVTLLSTKWLVDQSFNSALLDARVHIASAIASQWFGGIVIPADTTDCWVVEGLANYLLGAYVRTLTGLNELSFRRMKDMRIASRLDDGVTLPPLASRAARIWRGGHYAGPDVAAGGSPHPLPSHVEHGLKCKASTVIYMLEKRLGPDVMQKVLKYFAGLHVRRNKKDQNTRTGPSAEVLASNARWIHTIQMFDHCRATVNLGKGEVNSFLERWVYGAGTPKLAVGYVVKRRKNVMEFAVKLEGSEAAAAADRAALAVARNHRTSVTVRMREENRTDANDHVVSLGTTAWQLMEIPLQPRPKDRRPKTIIESGGDPELIAAMDCPVHYVRVDPEFEWMGNIEQNVKQIGLESMMAQMLEREMDVVAQTVAVEFLGRRVMNGSVSAVLVLDKCLNSENTFCRVRAEAAIALGTSASAKTQWGGLNALIRHYRANQCDAETGKPRQNDFRDLAKTIVDEAVITALGLVRDSTTNFSHPDALEALMDRLEYNDNEGNPQSDDGFVTTVIEALARTVPPDAEMLNRIVQLLQEYVLRDEKFPSDDMRVTAAAIRALGILSASIDDEELQSMAAKGAELGFALEKQSTFLAAADTMMYLAYSRSKNEMDSLAFMLERSKGCPTSTRSALLWSACDYLETFGDSPSLKGVTPNILKELRELVMHGGAEVASAAFSIISLLASRDPSFDEVREAIAIAIKRAGDQIAVGVAVHQSAPRTAEDEAKRAEKEAKRARKRERELAKRAVREAEEHQVAERRRIAAEAAYVNAMAENVEETQTQSGHTATFVTGGEEEPETPATFGIKRERESVKSFVETPTVKSEDAEAPTPAPAKAESEEPPKKLKKLTFTFKKPTA